MASKRNKTRRKARKARTDLQTAFETTARFISPAEPRPEASLPKRKRPRRVFVPGGIYHVRCYANNREPLFRDQDDHDEFDRLLLEGVVRYGHKVLAVKKLGDHVHLVIQVGNTFLDQIMHNLCLRYARWYNGRHGRTGHVFGRRYAAILIDAERYLRGLVRFVHDHQPSGSVPSQVPYTTGSPTDRRFLGDDAFIQRCLLAARPLR